MNSVKLDRKIAKTLDIINLLHLVPIFDKLTHKEARIVARYMELIEMDKGEILFNEGDKGDYMCFVVEGIMEVMKTSRKSKDNVIAIIGRGRSIGEMSVIDEYPRSATVLIKTKAKLIILTRKSFNLILIECPTTGIKILKGITRLISLNLRKTSGRFIEYLLPVN